MFNTYNDYYMYYINIFKKEIKIYLLVTLIAGICCAITVGIGSDTIISGIIIFLSCIPLTSLPIIIIIIIMNIYNIKKLENYIAYNNLYAMVNNN